MTPKLQFLLFILICLLAFGAWLAWSKYETRHIFYNNQGVKFQAQDNLSGSLVEYKKALEIQPKNAVYNMNIGTVYFELGDYPQAKKHFAVSFADKNIGEEQKLKIYSYLADMDSKLGNYKKALQYARQILAKKPNDPNSLYIQAGVLNSKEMYNYTGALDSISKYIRQVSDDPAGYNTKGEIEYNASKFDSAISNFEKATSLSQKSGNYLLLGHSYIALGKDSKALATYKKGLQLFPNNYDYRFYVGYAFYQLGDYKQAYSYISEAYAEMKKANVENEVIKFYYLLATYKAKKRTSSIVLLKKLYNLPYARLKEVIGLKSVLDELGPNALLESLKKIK